MAAAQVNTTAANLIAADPDQHRMVVVQNLGPNPIYLEVGAAATVAGGLEIATDAVSPPIALPPGVVVSAIAATALQVTPADTRYLIT